MMEKLSILYLVVPCYNEETILLESMARLRTEFERLLTRYPLSPESRILLVNDGSTDRTPELIRSLVSAGNSCFSGLFLARNFGHQAALLSGLMFARDRADCAISLDADLQDDIGVMDDFMREFFAGADIVYGVRNDRTSDTWFKRSSAEMFYFLMSKLGGRVIKNHADYRLMSRRALEKLSEYGECNLYLRGIVPLLGLRQAIVLYKRQAATRKTHYPLGKMLMLAWDGITSFSIKPIRLISLLGFLMMAASFVMLLLFLWERYFGSTVRGWTSLIAVCLLLGGIQLFCLGVIGEYIGKIYTEVKRRPRYLIESVMEGGADESGQNR